MQRFLRKLSAKVGLEATVSARALNPSRGAPRILLPVRQEAPGVGRDRPPITPLDDDRSRVGRSEVEVTSGVVDERLGVEQLGQLGRRALLGEAAAHRSILSLVRVRAMDPTAPEPAAASSRDPRTPGRWTARPR